MTHPRFKKSQQGGFTLVEVLLYIVFIAFILGGTIGIVNQLLRNSENLRTGISAEEEGNFVLKKISWVINDAGSISYPPVNSSGVSLSVVKNSFSENPVVVDLDGGIIRIKRGAGPYKQLSNNRFVISGLKFQRLLEGSDPDTEYVRVSFVIEDREFELTRKIR